MNEVTQSNDRYYISYCQERSEFAAACDSIMEAFGDRPKHTGQPETALCITDLEGPTSFYILYGDHREAYSKQPDLEACMNYFIHHIESIASSSDTPPINA